jgi:hypothetical protein
MGGFLGVNVGDMVLRPKETATVGSYWGLGWLYWWNIKESLDTIREASGIKDCEGGGAGIRTIDTLENHLIDSSISHNRNILLMIPFRDKVGPSTPYASIHSPRSIPTAIDGLPCGEHVIFQGQSLGLERLQYQLRNWNQIERFGV